MHFKEKAKELLKEKHNWVNNYISDSDVFYHSLFPEFTMIIEIDFNSHNTAYYSFAMVNESTHFGEIKIQYNGVPLESLPVVCLDSGRYLTSTPQAEFIRFDNKRASLMYSYFLKNSLLYEIHKFLLNEEDDEAYFAYKRLMEFVLLFEDQEEKYRFNQYVTNNTDRFNELFNSLTEYPFIKEGYHFEKMRVARVFKIMLNEFKTEI